MLPVIKEGFKTGSFITDLSVDEHSWSEEAFRIFEFHPATKVTVRVMGHELEIHPLLAIFTLMMGGSVDGIVGIYLSMPLVVALRVISGNAQLPGLSRPGDSVPLAFVKSSHQ